jgi:hypothetical protein
MKAKDVTDENNPVDPGGVERAYVIRCAICDRMDVVLGESKSREGGAAAIAEDAGWKQTSQLGSEGDRLWVCEKHHEPGTYDLFVHKEEDRRTVHSVEGLS